MFIIAVLSIKNETFYGNEITVLHSLYIYLLSLYYNNVHFSIFVYNTLALPVNKHRNNKHI